MPEKSEDKVILCQICRADVFEKDHIGPFRAKMAKVQIARPSLILQRIRHGRPVGIKFLEVDDVEFCLEVVDEILAAAGVEFENVPVRVVF